MPLGPDHRAPFDETDPAQLHDIFQYHPPTTQEEIDKYTHLRAAAEHFAKEIVDLAPRCADRTYALRMVREALMWANAAIALKGKV